MTECTSKELRRLAFINRQPSLSRHSCPIVQLEPIDDLDDETIHVSPLFLEPLNMDIDGDCAYCNVILYKKYEDKLLLNKIHISEFDKYITVEFEGIVTRSDGTSFKNYKVLDEIYTKAINIETGSIDLKQITHWSIHENLNMYKIERKKNSGYIHNIKNLYISDNHSLVVFDRFNENILKLSPLEIIKDLNRYFLIRTHPNENKIEFIPCSLLNIEKEPTITTGYDFTVKDYKTFISEHGIFLYDTAAIYALHDQNALKEAEEKAFLKNTLKYDQNDNFLATIRHEALYAAFVLSKQEWNKDNIKFRIRNLAELPESFKIWNEDLYSAVKLNEDIYSYGICLFNKFCGFDKVLINTNISKKQINKISETIYKYFNDNELFYKNLTNLEKSLFFFISSTEHSPSVDIEEMVSVKDNHTNNIFKNLPNNNIKLGFYITEALTNKCINNMSKDSSLYKLYKSGSRFSRAQLARSAILIGYSADDNNRIMSRPIKTSLLEGLTEEQYFRVAPATRKSIQDRNIVPF
ncbi:MAG: hypothetical protein WC188_04690 [Candidatus Caldatribacteriota bacterium]|nr:hypothetical protein [Patescibacteria group bacterium]